MGDVLAGICRRLPTSTSSSSWPSFSSGVLFIVRTPAVETGRYSRTQGTGRRSQDLRCHLRIDEWFFILGVITYWQARCHTHSSTHFLLPPTHPTPVVNGTCDRIAVPWVSSSPIVTISPRYLCTLACQQQPERTMKGTVAGRAFLVWTYGRPDWSDQEPQLSQARPG